MVLPRECDRSAVRAHYTDTCAGQTSVVGENRVTAKGAENPGSAYRHRRTFVPTATPFSLPDGNPLPRPPSYASGVVP